jgi:butyrate kinase
MSGPKILVINPGSTSTKLAYYAGEAQAWQVRIDHPEDELGRFADIPSQLQYRLGLLMAVLEDKGVRAKDMDAVSARGGLMKPVKSGVYRVNRWMVEDLKGSMARWGREHASNLGAMMALELSQTHGMPAFTADPVTVDEMDEVARISGVPEITRKSHLHALNIKACFRRAIKELGLSGEDANLVIAHVGGGTSIAAVKGGRIVDVNNALLGMGPFSPSRAGALPIGDLVGLAFSGRYTREGLEKKLVYESGLTGYLGTPDVREIEARIDAGDLHAALVFSAMAYQVSKEIAAMAAVLSGHVDAIVLTGGVANSTAFVDMVGKRVKFIARVLVYPGESEMDALAAYARAALDGTAKVLEYD